MTGIQCTLACIFTLALNVIQLNAQTQQALAQRLDSFMQAAHTIGVFNGNVLVAYKNKIIYQSSLGYADISSKTALTAEYRFDIGSVSKEFNGVGIALLVQQGKLKPEDKVSTYLPNLPSWAQNIEIRQLLNYTSGLAEIPVYSDTALLDSLMHLEKPAFAPGTVYSYAYPNVYLQQRIIEKVTGLSYKKFIESAILRPCGMIEAGVDLPVNGSLMAHSFDINLSPVTYDSKITGWVRLTAMDLYKWTKCLSAFQLIKQPGIQLLSQNFGNGENSLGSTVYENGILKQHQHYGSNYNYEAMLYSHAADSLTIILLSNSQHLRLGALKDGLAAIVKNQPYIVPKRSIYLDIREKVLADFEKGLAYFRQLKATAAGKYDFTAEPFELINTAKYLMRKKQFDNAIALLNLSISPGMKNSDLSYVYELIADCWQKLQHHRQMAILYYQKAADTDATNKNARSMFEKLMQEPM